MAESRRDNEPEEKTHDAAMGLKLRPSAEGVRRPWGWWPAKGLYLDLRGVFLYRAAREIGGGGGCWLGTSEEKLVDEHFLNRKWITDGCEETSAMISSR